VVSNSKRFDSIRFHEYFIHGKWVIEVAFANAGGAGSRWYDRAAGRQKNQKRKHEYAAKRRASKPGHTLSFQANTQRRAL